MTIAITTAITTGSDNALFTAPKRFGTAEWRGILDEKRSAVAEARLRSASGLVGCVRPAARPLAPSMGTVPPYWRHATAIPLATGYRDFATCRA